MATPSTADALRLAGNLRFLVGGVSTDDLIGEFVKGIRDGRITYQDMLGVEREEALGEIELPTALTEQAVGGPLTPTGVGNWHAYETTELIQPEHTYEFLMQKGADSSVLLPTIAFTGKELIQDVPVTDNAAGDGYDPNTEQNHLGVVHGATTSGSNTVHVAHLARQPGDTTDSLLLHFQSTTYRVHSLIRRPGIPGPKGDKGDPGDASIPDNSIHPTQAQADTQTRKKVWRERLGSARILVAITLPDFDDTNDGDIVIISQDVASGLSFVDVGAPTTEVTSAQSTDVIMALTIAGQRRWARLGNLLGSRRVLLDVEAASADTVDKIVLRDENAYLTETYVAHEGTSAAATFVDYSSPRYIGALNADPEAFSHTDGQWYYNFVNHQARVVVNTNPLNPQQPVLRWTDANLSNLIASGTYRGDWPDDAEATKHIAARFDYYFNRTTVRLRRATSYTAPGGAITEQRFKRLGEARDVATAQRTAEAARNYAEQEGQRLEGDIQQSSFHVSLLWPDGTSQPLSYMNTRTIGELFQRNDDGALAVQNARSPIGFQIEGYIRGFDGIANLRALRINGAVARDNSALGIEERISGGHFNLVGHPSNRDLGNIIGSIGQGQIAFAIEYTINGQDGIHEVRLPVDTRAPRELPDRVPYIHPEYLLDDIYRRVSELRVEESAQIWETLTDGLAQIAGISAASATGMAILGGTFDPTTIPPAVVWGYTFTQAADASQRIVLLARIPINAVDREDQLDDRFRVQIARTAHPTVTTTVGGPIAQGDNFYYLHVGGANANAGDRVVFTLQQLTNPFRTIYNDKLGPRAIASIPGGGGGGGGIDQAARDAAAAAQSIADAALPATGGTMTGPLILSGDPAANLHASTKQYVDNLLATIRDNLLVDNPTSPIAPTDANADKILVRGGRLYENVLHSATDPVVTYRDFTQADWRTAIGDNNAEWGGAVQTSTASQHPANYGIYSIPGGHFEFRVGSGFPAFFRVFNMPNWRGAASDKLGADERVTAVGDITYYGGTVRVVTAFTAGTSRSRTWTPIVSVPADQSVTADKLAPGVIRAYADQVATPAAGDRFFFTDENQPGDPLRYVQMASLASAMGVRTRFETVVGASPATLPAGTYKIAGMLRVTDNGEFYFPFDLLISQLATTDRTFYFDTHNPGATSNATAIFITARYNPSSRALTYSVRASALSMTTALTLESLVAIGEV